MNPTQNKDINVHEYPEGADKRTLPAYRIAVMQAFYEGKKIEVRATQKSAFLRSTLGIPASVPIDGGWHILTKFEPNEPEFNWSYYDYRITKIAEGHNPDKLTVDQVEVSKGYRLLTADEIEGAKQRGAEYWQIFDGRWAPVTLFGRHHAKSTYRTKAAPGAYLPNPKPRYFRRKTGLFPVDLTAPRNYCVEIIAPDTTTQVFLDGTRKTVDDEYARWSIEQAEKAVAFGDWVEFDGNMDPFRPEVAIGYNPANVTEDQIPAGWRLFSHEEKAALGNTVVSARFWEGTKWSEVAACVLLDGPMGTLITQKPDGFYLPKPAVKPESGVKPGRYHLVGGFKFATVDYFERDAAGGWTHVLLNGEKHPASSAVWGIYDGFVRNGTWIEVPAAQNKIAEGNNPARLTEEQVDVKNGWRLLTIEEIYHRRATTHSQKGLPEIHRWLPTSEQWSNTGWLGTVTGNTYRTNRPAGHFLPKPATKSVTRYKRIGGSVCNERYLEVDNESRTVTLVMNDGRKIPVNHCYTPESCERYVAVGSWEKEVVEVPKQT